MSCFYDSQPVFSFSVKRTNPIFLVNISTSRTKHQACIENERLKADLRETEKRLKDYKNNENREEVNKILGPSSREQRLKQLESMVGDILSLKRIGT